MARRKKLTAALAAVFLLVAALFLAACAAKEPMPAVGTTFVMNTVVEYKLYGEKGEDARKGIDAALRDIEDRMSLYVEGSEIQRINENAGKAWTPVSEDTFRLLSRCVKLETASGGVFDVTIAPLTELWGITTDHPRVPGREEIAGLLPLVDYRDLLLDEGTRSAMLAREGQALDLGGIAKGFACDESRRVAQEYGVRTGYISIGGNLMVLGDKPGGKPFLFGIRDPRGGANDYLATLSVKDTTVATSGDYERFFERDGVRYHHILDPATGAPADTDLMEVTVVSPDGALADFLSTDLFIRGKDAALNAMEVLDSLDSVDCGLVLVDREKNVYVSKGLSGSVVPADQTGNYRFQVEQ